jgi:nucleoid DNA-binding protein
MHEMATKVAAKNKKRPAAKSTAGKPRTKSELFTAIAEKTELTRRQVASVFEQLGAEIKKDIGKRAGGTVFKVGGLMTIKARKGINPFTGEEMTFKAKPASRKVKILATKALKDIVA